MEGTEATCLKPAMVQLERHQLTKLAMFGTAGVKRLYQRAEQVRSQILYENII